MTKLSLAVCLALMALPAMAQEDASPAPALSPMPAMSNALDPSDSPATAADRAAMMKMHEGMNHYSGDPDRDFVQNMLPHHQGAVDMAEVELQYGKDPTLRKLATNIIAAQEKEIAMMKDWLAKHQGK
jgi:uncharacterized protein (DUF305 family)